MFQTKKRPVRFFPCEPITEFRPSTVVVDNDGSKTTSFSKVDVMTDVLPAYDAVTLEEQLQAGVPLYPVDSKILDGDSSALLDKIKSDTEPSKD